jgi:hypothetical protein
MYAVSRLALRSLAQQRQKHGEHNGVLGGVAAARQKIITADSGMERRRRWRENINNMKTEKR